VPTECGPSDSRRPVAAGVAAPAIQQAGGFRSRARTLPRPVGPPPLITLVPPSCAASPLSCSLRCADPTAATGRRDRMDNRQEGAAGSAWPGSARRAQAREVRSPPRRTVSANPPHIACFRRLPSARSRLHFARCRHRQSTRFHWSFL
jgi:hypothetical protein